jgi:cytochrome c5
MSIDTIRRQKSGALVLFSALSLLMLLGTTGCSDKETAAPEETAPAETTAPEAAMPEATPPAEESAPAAAPAAEPEAAAEPAAEATAAADGEKTYQTFCQVCHAAGVANAPKLGDKEAWAPRIAKGNDVLLSSVVNGLNAMPPKGTCMTCSEDDLRAAMQYMVDQGS